MAQHIYIYRPDALTRSHKAVLKAISEDAHTLLKENDANQLSPFVQEFNAMALVPIEFRNTSV